MAGSVQEAAWRCGCLQVWHPLRQFTPIGMIASGPLVWAANTRLPVNTMKELVALARQKPGVLNYGSAGAGGVNHLVLELLKARTATFIEADCRAWRNVVRTQNLKIE
ncbi:MAG: tripartite tricarboxylate transporter substrate-binding protein [Polaromonas sp.]